MELTEKQEDKLTPRQLYFWTMYKKGLTPEEIVERHGSTRTVNEVLKGYASIEKKLGIKILPLKE